MGGHVYKKEEGGGGRGERGGGEGRGEGPRLIHSTYSRLAAAVVLLCPRGRRRVFERAHAAAAAWLSCPAASEARGGGAARSFRAPPALGRSRAPCRESR